MTIRTGYIHGTGATLNVELGFIPDYVHVWHATTGDNIYQGILAKVIVFTSGGTTEIKKGQTLTGVTSGATAKIREVLLDSGSWSAGNAAGWFICDSVDVVGTIQSENMDANGTGDNDVTVVVDVEYGIDINTEVAAVTGTSGFLSYDGDASLGYSQGFTVGSVLGSDGELMGFVAMKNDSSVEPLVLGNPQSTLW